MDLISRIAVPIYDDRESCTAFDHALRLADRFKSRLLIAAIVQEHLFVRPSVGAAGIIDAEIDEKGLKDFEARVSATGKRLADSAKERGQQAQFILTRQRLPDAFVALTRECDLVVDSRLQRRAPLGRVFGDPDIYSDSCCPTLVARGEPLALGRILLPYDWTRRANEALRWLTLFAGIAGEVVLHVLAICRPGGDQARLPGEISAIVERRGVTARIDTVARRRGPEKVLRAIEELRPGIVAVPPHIMDRVKLLRDIQSSLLLL